MRAIASYYFAVGLQHFDRLAVLELRSLVQNHRVAVRSVRR